MRAEVKDAQRGIGLHYLHLFRILVEEVAMCEQKVSHHAPLPVSTSSSGIKAE
jgi:hypothetical protein